MSYLIINKFFWCYTSLPITVDLRLSLSELSHFVNYSNMDQDPVLGQECSGGSDPFLAPNKDLSMGYCLNTDTQHCQMYHYIH